MRWSGHHIGDSGCGNGDDKQCRRDYHEGDARSRGRRLGWAVLVVDTEEFPRDKACGDGLTPRAVAELQLLGLGGWLDNHITHRGLRLTSFGGDIEVDWPGPLFPATGSAVPRTELDERIRQLAATTGASMVPTSKVVDIKHDSCGRVSSLLVSRNGGHIEVGCRELIVADGARSPLGRTLGRQGHQQTEVGIGPMHSIATGSAPAAMASSSTNDCGSNSDRLPDIHHGAADRDDDVPRQPPSAV
jgi:flavin-dependent dehydrogenase